MPYPPPPPEGHYRGRPHEPDPAGDTRRAAAGRALSPPDGWHTHPSWARAHRTIGGRRVHASDLRTWSPRTYCGHRVPGDAQAVTEPTTSTCGPCWTATADEATDSWTVLVSIPESKLALRLAPDGTLTRRRVHAALIATRSRAERIAAEITADPEQPGVTARAARF
jgi:hypothetical protein